jgi:adiponectin receptor
MNWHKNVSTLIEGGLIFMCIGVHTYTSTHKEYDHYVTIGPFFLGAILCLFFSASYHAFCCYSLPVSNLFRKLDYAGISILTMGSFVPWLHYAFMCDIAAKAFYMIFIGVLGLACIAVSLIDKFGAAEYRATRAGKSALTI